VLLHSIDGDLYIATTDSYRLAEKRLSKTIEEVSLLIPATALHDVLRIIDDYTGDIQLTYDDQQVQFLAGDVELVARLIEGKYPDYRKLIPTTFETKVTISRSELLNMVKVTSLFARESAGSVVLSVDEPSQSIWIRAVASQLGENNATATAVAKGSGSVTLNSRYLQGALQALSGKEVTISFNGKIDPILLSDPSVDDYQHIIMPLKS
jgi:DNA polymerase-3 subunit beta